MMPLTFFDCNGDHLDLHSFPTRRSPDLFARPPLRRIVGQRERDQIADAHGPGMPPLPGPSVPRFVEVLMICKQLDRKSTRLNSSHLGISYAVFCLKKKTERTTILLPVGY